MYNINLGEFKSSGYAQICNLIASPKRYPSVRIGIDAYVAVCTSHVTQDLVRTITSIMQRLKMVAEVFEPPGDDIISGFGDTMFNDSKTDFNLEFGANGIRYSTPSELQSVLVTITREQERAYIAARLAGYDQHVSYFFMVKVLDLMKHDQSYKVKFNLKYLTDHIDYLREKYEF
ncbi:hypothetical protein BC830DRAFT_1173299 [Chytriomyces sp. MP71]|nr:hypothetical protein BC830DRAFT_1173299 [Chytriomyces sp. MP71]